METEKTMCIRLEKLENKVQSLEDKIDKLISVCSRMDGHINFVENTYTSLRTPLDFIKNGVERAIGYTKTHELPRLENMETD